MTAGKRGAVNRAPRPIHAGFRFMMHPIKRWIPGAFLLALASVSMAEPIQEGQVLKHTQNRVEDHAVAAVGAPPATPLILLPIAAPHVYKSPFEKEYDARPGQTSAATPGNPDESDTARAGARAGPLAQNGLTDSDGVPFQALHATTLTGATVGDWDLSAAAHLPVLNSRDVGAAISARHDF
ncbi:hypothetical protein [Paraburkholderia youngii]|uniref:hypothetical protein n=1 Tax=Paraburkholderia youngii TaxID=2782701 RepID=UPI00158FEB5B|nr:hypothetical protein [Paraburkholderia youngii]NUX59053.1 hypothetical protein [Paraburkholderia youngii]